MRRALGLAVFIGLLLAAVALGLVFAVLRTEAGAGWVLGVAEDRLAGFSYERHEGSLAGGLVLGGLAYRQDDLRIDAEQLRLHGRLSAQVLGPRLPAPQQVTRRNLRAPCVGRVTGFNGRELAQAA